LIPSQLYKFTERKTHFYSATPFMFTCGFIYKKRSVPCLHVNKGTCDMLKLCLCESLCETQQAKYFILVNFEISQTYTGVFISEGDGQHLLIWWLQLLLSNCTRHNIMCFKHWNIVLLWTFSEKVLLNGFFCENYVIFYELYKFLWLCDEIQLSLIVQNPIMT